MNYLKSLLTHFLIVFFANYTLPGIQAVNSAKLPHVGGDLVFAFVLGALNSAIYPALKLFKQQISIIKIALIVLILNFVGYAIVKFISLGIQVMDWEGYLLVASVVSVGSFTLNFLEWRKNRSLPNDSFHV